MLMIEINLRLSKAFMSRFGVTDFRPIIITDERFFDTIIIKAI